MAFSIVVYHYLTASCRKRSQMIEKGKNRTHARAACYHGYDSCGQVFH